MTKLLKKGLEIELYAGDNLGNILPLSEKLIERFPDFAQEPDQRNFEYITIPKKEYDELLKEIIEPRMLAREYLKSIGDLTLIPGSTIPLPFDKCFYRSKPEDLYHDLIEKTYKTNVITTSLHINFGIDDKESLFKLLSALRLDMPLFLALSASSCFHDGNLTGYHSYRWHSFPKTPDFVPLFNNHNEFIDWTNKQLASKKMFNIRHLWTSIRPNGPNRPYDLNRIEIRICDLVTDIRKVLGVVGFIECIIQKYLQENNWPKILEQKDSKEVVKTIEEQEELTAKSGLNAKIWNWRNDTKDEAYKIIESLYKDLNNIAKELNISNHLEAVTDILKDGNEAMQFLEMYKRNKSISQTIKHFTYEFNVLDLKSYNMIKKALI